MATVEVRGISMMAYHGCIEEEARVGGRFTVDVRIQTDFTKAVETDRLEHAVDYVRVSEIVRNTMTLRVKLIEKAAHNILVSLRKAFPKAGEMEVWITKHRAPIEKNVKEVAVYLSSHEI